MSEKITLTNEGKTYTLEYTRRSIEIMERRGFDPEAMTSKPMTMLPALFAGAFIAHHADVSKETIEYLFANVENKNGLIEKLARMFAEPINTLLEQKEDAPVKWSE